MRLLYWYTRFLDVNGNPRKYHGLDDFELNLSTDTKYHFDENTYELLHEPYRTPLPKYFWGNQPLYNFCAISGQNGTGKSTVIHTILSTLQELFNRELNSQNETVFILQNSKESVLFHLKGSNNKPSEIKSSFTQLCLPQGKLTLYEKHLKIIDGVKLIYFTNNLSESDDDRYHSSNQQPHARANFIYDCSLSGTIRHDSNDDNNSVSQQDLLRTYFVNEYYKQVKFVCDSTQAEYLSLLNQRQLRIPVPKQLSITIRANNNEHKDRFDFSQVIKDQKDSSEKIVYCLCVSCFYTLLDNLGHNYNENKIAILPSQIKIPNSASFEEFRPLFETVYFNLRHGYLVPPQNELRNKCLSFVYFVCNSKEQIKQFDWSQSNLKALEKGLPFTFTVPVHESNNDWLIEFMERYRQTCVPYYFLDFSWGLSSGENNLLRLFSSLFYAFDYSRSNLYNWFAGERRNKCDSVILLIDEADLSYHPEWQRQLIQILAAFLPLEFGNCGIDDLQLILTTHSPLLLGDFPSNNVTYLGKSNKKEKNNDRLNTFGQNIHTILKDSFFLENGTIGAFAADKINKTAEKLRDKDNLTPEDLKECKAIIDLVAPGILKSKLIELYEKTEEGGKESMKQRMKKYAKRLQPDELETFIKVLEEEKRTKNDKN